MYQLWCHSKGKIMNNIESVNSNDAVKLASTIVLAMQMIEADNITAALDDLDHALWLLGTSKDQVESEVEEELENAKNL